MTLSRALVVEDLPEPRQWLVDLLPIALPNIHHIDQADTLATALQLVRKERYDLALVDWDLPDGNSEPLIQEICQRSPKTQVIVATIHDDDSHVFPALRAGASGYILKSQPEFVVIEQLRRTQKNEPALSPSVAQRLLQHFRADPAPALSMQSDKPVETLSKADAAPLDSDEPALTSREQDTLRLIAKGYKVNEVAQLLDITSHTVTSYIRDIYRKLGINSRAEATLAAARRGLVA